jgi:7-cyano-7-deazaguanine synthase
MRVAMILSGGVESLVVAAKLRRDHPTTLVHGVFVDYGQRAAERERRAVQRIVRTYGFGLEEVQMTLPFLADHALIDPDTLLYSAEGAQKLGVPLASRIDEVRTGDRVHIVPYRNLVFASIAASFATGVGATEIWTGFDYRPEREGAATDKSPAFVDTLNATLAAAREGVTVRVVAPVQHLWKHQTVSLGEEIGVDWTTAWSCYNDLYAHCGVCGSCGDRRRAFSQAGVSDPTTYCPTEYVRGMLPEAAE